MRANPRHPSPIAGARQAVVQARAELSANVNRWADEIEARLKRVEDERHAGGRTVLELEGYLARIAAIAGVDADTTGDWSEVVKAIDKLVEDRRELEVLFARAQARLREADGVARRLMAQTAALARVAGRLGLSTTNPNEILEAIDRMQPAGAAAR